MRKPELSFDKKGINGPDEYRERVATFTNDADAKKYGPLFEAAPELLGALKALVKDAEALVKDLNPPKGTTLVSISNAKKILRGTK